jgi:hypothetical protein
MQVKIVTWFLFGALLGAGVLGFAVYVFAQKRCESQILDISYTTNFVEAKTHLECLELIERGKQGACVTLLENRLSSVLLIVDQLQAAKRMEESDASRELFNRAKSYGKLSDNPALFDSVVREDNDEGR